MKSLKDYSIDATYIYNLEKEKNFSKCKNLIIGKNGVEEYRAIFNIELKKVRQIKEVNENIKVELGIFLKNIALDSDIDSYMIDIGINKCVVDVKKINYMNYPKCSQQYTLYKIMGNLKNKYVNLDITHVLQGKLEEEYLGITLLGLNDGGKLEFDSTEAERRPFLKIFYENDVEVTQKKAAYGYFVSKNHQPVKCNNYEMVLWDKSTLAKNLFLKENKTDIVFLEKGVYQIDYSLNIRSEGKGYIFLNLNDEPLKYSFVQTTYDEHMYSGHILIEIKEKNSKLNMCIAGKGIIVVHTDFAGNLRILRI